MTAAMHRGEPRRVRATVPCAGSIVRAGRVAWAARITLAARAAHAARALLIALFALAPVNLAPLAAEPIASRSRSPSADTVISASFALKDSASVSKSLVSGAAKAASPGDRAAILSALADYEERSGDLADAARHFNEAAFADPAARDDGFLLDSARCLAASGDASGADGLVRAVLLTCFDQTTLVRARAYSAWVQLSSGDRAGALPLIRSYAATAAFSPYASALLFTLWWADGDADARKKLLDSYPASPEASIARGETRLSAAPFWFLMERSPEPVARFAKDGAASLPGAQPVAVSTTLQAAQPVAAPSAQATATQTTATFSATAAPASPAQTTQTTATFSATVVPASPAQPAASATTPSSTTTAATSTATTVPAATVATGAGRWQQTGFFRVREYAEELRGKLKKAGFDAIIREEKRPSGTVYFSVLVPEGADRTVGDRLKDAGFESYLVTD